jgi:predicted nuclease of predicted toxin-antitoxin system
VRVLIDECIDERLRNSFPTHECHTARFAGFAGLKNGELLNAAESGQYDVLVTVDQGLEYEQNLAGRKLAIIVLRAKSNRLKIALVRTGLFEVHIVDKTGRDCENPRLKRKGPSAAECIFSQESAKKKWPML